MKYLIVVESPTKAKTLEKFLEKQYLVLPTMGHIKDLPKSKLGVEIENNFRPQYQYVAKKETLSRLKQAIKEAEQVYLATDPDREGEAIASHVEELAKKVLKPDQIKRITFHEITKTALLNSLSSPGKVNYHLVDAQIARRVLDRLVGYTLSPVLWKKIRRGLSAGRVQSVVLRLIVEREKERRAFNKKKYWRISAAFEKEGKFLTGELVRFQGKKLMQRKTLNLFAGSYSFQETFLHSLSAAEKVVTNFYPPFIVKEVISRSVLRQPPPPLATATLQQQANRFLGFTSRQTMALAQRLYEKGLITYHRTDSLNLSEEARKKMRLYIEKNYGLSYLPPKPRFFKNRARVAQEAHEAIRPTNFKRLSVADKKENRLYQLIWSRALASQMAAASWQSNRVKVADKEGNLFALRHKKLLFDGFLKVLGRDKEEKEWPEIKEGEILKTAHFSLIASETLPPPRYSEASLIALLEKEGIGRPSTYAPIITTIKVRQYAEKEEGEFKPTALGEVVSDFLKDHFIEIVSLPFTAEMEAGLDQVANGKKKWPLLIKNFYDPFLKKVREAEKAERVKVPVEKTGEKCPKCHQGELVIRTGRFGKFISCSRFPECDYTAPYIEKVPNVSCPKCGGDIIVKRTKKGRKFYGCSNYPRCRWASWRKPKAKKK